MMAYPEFYNNPHTTVHLKFYKVKELLVVVSLVFFTMNRAFAFETINSATLSASALTPACMRYQTVGVCFYLVCSMFECHIETNSKIAHFNPDLVVSAYNSLAQSDDPVAGNPWTEAKTITGSIATASASALSSALGGAFSLPSGGHFSHGKHQNMIFKEADAIGHPLASVTSQMGTGGMLCPSDATSFKPYFMSGFDVLAWRWNVPEQVYPQTWIPGVREIGHFPANTWGAIYPRGGMATQSDEAKMASVIAQRAGDIVTRSGQPHVYLPLGEGQEGYNLHVANGMMVWSPGQLKENDASGGWWQIVVPNTELSCQVFGKNDTLTPTDWGGGKIAETSNYAFTLWRPYQCCNISGLFLGYVDFTSNIPRAD